MYIYGKVDKLKMTTDSTMIFCLYSKRLHQNDDFFLIDK